MQQVGVILVLSVGRQKLKVAWHHYKTSARQIVNASNAAAFDDVNDIDGNGLLWYSATQYHTTRARPHTHAACTHCIHIHPYTHTDTHLDALPSPQSGVPDV